MLFIPNKYFESIQTQVLVGNTAFFFLWAKPLQLYSLVLHIWPNPTSHCCWPRGVLIGSRWLRCCLGDGLWNARGPIWKGDADLDPSWGDTHRCLIQETINYFHTQLLTLCNRQEYCNYWTLHVFTKSMFSKIQLSVHKPFQRSNKGYLFIFVLFHACTSMYVPFTSVVWNGNVFSNTCRSTWG